MYTGKKVTHIIYLSLKKIGYRLKNDFLLICWYDHSTCNPLFFCVVSPCFAREDTVINRFQRHHQAKSSPISNIVYRLKYQQG